MRLREQICSPEPEGAQKAVRGRPCAPLAAAALLFSAAGGCGFRSEGMQRLDFRAADAGRPSDSILERQADARADVVRGDADASSRRESPVELGPDKTAQKDFLKHDSKSACALAAVGESTQWFNASTPYSIGGYVFVYLGFGAPGATFGVSCGGAASVPDQACPIGSTTVISVPSDGRKISIYPSSANAASSYASIKVEML